MVAVGGVITAMTVGIVAASSPALAARVVFLSNAVPNTGVHNGTVITDTGTGAFKSTAYLCAQIIVNPTTAVVAVKLLSTKTVTSNATGKVICKQTFNAWQAKDSKGVVRHCPLTTADRTAHFLCGIGLADKASKGAKSASLAVFSTG
jgi:hypothetical protein